MLSLYLVTDSDMIGDRQLPVVVQSAVSGGVTCVQLREKNAATRKFISLAEQLLAVLHDTDVPLIINDRVDIALAVGAHGVHLGQCDMPYEIARKLLGNKAIIGVSVNTMNDVIKMNDADVNYIAVGPVFPTSTKLDTSEEWGLEGLAQARRNTHHHILAIGGITKHNVCEVMRNGADGIAVVSAICNTESPHDAARDLRRHIDACVRRA